MAAIFGKRKIYWKLPRVHWLDTLWLDNFNEIALFCTAKEISKFVFFHFWQKFENSKWPPYVGRGKFFWKLPSLRVHFLDTLWIENFDEIALSRTVKEIETNLCFAIFVKIWKFKMAAIFGEGKFFENCQEYISYIPCGLKILTKSLYLARLRR